MLPLVLVGIAFILGAFFLPFDVVTKGVLLGVGIGCVIMSALLVRYALQKLKLEEY